MRADQESSALRNWCIWTVVLYLRVLWTAERSNQSILKKISSEYFLEGLMLRQKLQYFGHLTWKTDSLEKILMLGKIEGRRRWRHRMRWLDGVIDSMDMSKFKQVLGVGGGQGSLGAAVYGVTKSWTRLSNCTEVKTWKQHKGLLTEEWVKKI